MAEDTGTGDKDIKDSSNNMKHAKGLVLPPHWFLKQSRSRQGRIFYANTVLKATTWNFPSFTPCSTPCDDCQAYQANLKKKCKKKRKQNVNKSADCVSGDACKITSPQKCASNKVSTDSKTEKLNLKLSKGLKKSPSVRAQICNAQNEYSIDEKSTLHVKQVAEPGEDSNALHQKTIKEVLNAKKSEVKWNEVNSPIRLKSSSCISKTSEEDSLQRIQNDNTVSSTSTGNKMKAQHFKINQEGNGSSCHPSSSADSACHLPSNAKLSFNTPSSHDADSPRSTFGKGSQNVSFAIDTPKKLSVALKRSNSSDEDFTDKMTNFKKCRRSGDFQSSPEESKFIQQLHRKKKTFSDTNMADKAGQIPDSRSSQFSEISKVNKAPVVLPSLVTDVTLAQDKIISKVEFSTKNCNLPNLNSSLLSKGESSEDGCNSSMPQCTTGTSTISEMSIPSDMGMEVDIATELQTIRRANSDHTVDTVDIRPSSQLDILNSNDDDSGYLYAVVDTNVLISRLQLLKNISLARTATYKGQVIVVVIPYTALQELDGLKTRDSVKQRARAAINWCHECFSKRDASATVRAQSFANYRLVRDTLHGMNGDDHIRDCCLYLQQQGYPTVLLSDDINLRNKALVSDVTALDSATLAKDISYTATNNLPSTHCPTPSTPSSGAVSGDSRCSTPVAASARARHQTYVVRSNKKASTHQRESFRECEPDAPNESVNNASVRYDHDTSVRNDSNLTSSNINDADDPMEGLSSPSNTQCANNSLNSLRVTIGPMALSGASVGDESRSSSVCSPRSSKQVKCICKCSQNKESEESAVLDSLETTLGNILKFVMVKEYGDLWIQIVKHKPPWTLANIFDCWKKHWMAAFMDKFSPAFEKQLNYLDRLTSSRRVRIESSEFERYVLRLYNNFNKAPYKDLVQLPEKSVHVQGSEEKNCLICASENDSSKLGNRSISLDNNENMVSECDIPHTSTFSPVPRNQEEETVQAAKDLIIITGNRMGQFVTEGVSFLSAGPPQPALLGPLNTLQTCIDSLTASFVRCQQRRDAASADELSAAVLQFWRNAKEGEEQQQRFVSSETGRAAVRAFLQSAADTDFTVNCLQELQKMATLLDAELSKAAQMQTL